VTAKADRAEAARRLQALAVFDEMIDSRDVRSVASWVAQRSPVIELSAAEELKNEVLMRSLNAIPGLVGADYHAAIQVILRRMWKVHRDELRVILDEWQDTINDA